MERRKKNLAMQWIDYRKAYDTVPHSWVIESLNVMSIAKSVENFSRKTVNSWWVELTCDAETLNEVPIKREIFQGHALSSLLIVIALIPLTLILRTAGPDYEFRTRETINHLLFMDDPKLYSKFERDMGSLIQTVRIFREDIGMQFGVDKCTMLVIKRREIGNWDGTELPNEKVIKSLKERDSYKYLSVLEEDEVMVNEMKDKVKKE